MNATAMTLPSILINCEDCKPAPCLATRSSRGRITSSFIIFTIDELARIAAVYSPEVTPGRLISLCSEVRFLVISAPVQAAASAPTV